MPGIPAATSAARPEYRVPAAGLEADRGRQGTTRKGLLVAGVQRPSFLKRQKEQKRAAKAEQKREAKRLNKLAKAAGTAPAPEEEFELLDGPPDPQDME